MKTIFLALDSDTDFVNFGIGPFHGERFAQSFYSSYAWITFYEVKRSNKRKLFHIKNYKKDTLTPRG